MSTTIAPAFVNRLLCSTAGAWRRARERAGMRRQAQLLGQMSERELSDLGIGRSEVPGLLQRPRCEAVARLMRPHAPGC